MSLTSTQELPSIKDRLDLVAMINKLTDGELTKLITTNSNKVDSKRLEEALAQCPNTTNQVKLLCQYAILKNLLDRPAEEIESMSVNNIRETLNSKELITLAFTEMLAAKRISNDKPLGDKKCASVCGNTAKMVKSFSDLAIGNSNED